jgi:hypothetical protein
VSETWAVTDMDITILGIWERKILKRIYGASGRAWNMENEK